MSLWGVLLTGLFAGGASCAAVQGGLLAGVVARRRPTEQSPSAAPSSLGEDAVPVGAFLVGKLVSHTILGALLGLLGDAVQLGVSTRAAVQIGAGLVMIVLAADLFGWSAVRRVVPAPPAAWTRLVRRSARSSSAAAPAALGVATVLLPCGVTLGMEFLAVASGSAWAGAAIMATFVVGTSPLFAVIGYAARRSAVVLRGRLSLLAGVAVLVAGLVSVNTGLVLSDSSFTLAQLLPGRDRGGEVASPVSALPALGADGVQRVTLEATDDGYSPSTLRVRAGVPTELIVHTAGVTGCTRGFVIPGKGFEKQLPATGDTQVALGRLGEGRLRFTCSMGMYSGTIEAVP